MSGGSGLFITQGGDYSAPPLLPGDNASWPAPPGSPDLPLVMPVSLIITLVVVPAVLGGICANLLLLAVLVDSGVGRSPTRVLTVGVCVADLTSLLVALPLQLLAPRPPLLPPSHLLCASAALVEKLSVGSAIYFLSCLTLYKYLKICRPHFWQFNIRRAIRAAVICPWLVILVVWPSAVTVGSRDTPDGRTTCGDLEALDVTLVPKTYRALLSVVVLSFVVFSAIVYFCVLRQLRTLGNGRNGSSPSRAVASPWQRLRELLQVRRRQPKEEEGAGTRRTEPACLQGEAAGWGGQMEMTSQGKKKRKPLFVKASGPWPGRRLFRRRRDSSSSGLDRKALGTSGNYRHWSLGLDSVSEYDNFTKEDMARELCLPQQPGLATKVHVERPLSRQPEPQDLQGGVDRKTSFSRSISQQMERMYMFPSDSEARFYSLPWRNHRLTSNTFIDLEARDKSPADVSGDVSGAQGSLSAAPYLNKPQTAGKEAGTERDSEGAKSKADTQVRAAKTKEPRWYILVFLLISFPVLLLSFLPSPALHLVALVAPDRVASLASPFRQIWQVALRAFYFRGIVDPFIHLALLPRSTKRRTSRVTFPADGSPRGSSCRWV